MLDVLEATLFVSTNSAANALVFSALILASVLDLIAYGNNIAAVSSILTIKASAAIALVFSALILASVLDLIAYGSNISAVSALFVLRFNLASAAVLL